MSSPVRILIIIPTFNEAGAIGDLLRRIEMVAGNLPQYEVHVLHIDDSSSDGTAEIAGASYYRYFHQEIRPGKLGLGTAYLYGFRWALDSPLNFTAVVEMDGDGSHLPEELTSFLAVFERENLGGANEPIMVLGTRWMPGGQISNWPIYRRLISRLGTKYAQIALKLPFRDLTSGYRLFNRSAIETLSSSKLASKGYSFQIETAMTIVDSGGKIVEVPIHFVERTVGRSKMSTSIAMEAWWRITMWGLIRRTPYHR